MTKYITLAVILLLCACKKEEEPVPCFDFIIDGGAVNFNNCSTGSEDFQWEFGDNNTSITKSPKNDYASPGYRYIKSDERNRVKNSFKRCYHSPSMRNL